jgi:hypothetical protein
MAEEKRNVETLRGTPIGEHEEILPSGMQRDYLVLTREEREKGFVEPLRRSYRHVGIPGPKHELRDLTPEESERYADYGYAKFEPYPEGSRSIGRFWTREQLEKVGRGCGTVTTMGWEIAATYARQPEFYGGTFCCGCGKHLPVGEDGEFVWDKTDQRVGTRRTRA